MTDKLFRVRKTTSFIVVIALLILLTACSSRNYGSALGSAQAAPAASSAAPAAEAAAPSAAPSGGIMRDSAAGDSGVPVATQVSSERKIITTVDLRMESKEYDDCVNSIYKAIDAAGGYIEYSDIAGSIAGPSTEHTGWNNGKIAATPMGGDYGGGYNDSQYYREGDRRYLFLCIRIPQSGLGGFISQLEAYGNVLSKQESAKDITLQYVDIESHKKALLIEQEQLLNMLEKAETVEDMIKLQERLAEIRYQIERYESQLRVMDNQINYSTVNLTLNEVIVYTEKTEEPIPNPTIGQRISTGFSRTLSDIGNYWVNWFVWVMVNIVYILGVITGIIILIILLKKFAPRLRLSRSAEEGVDGAVITEGSDAARYEPEEADGIKKKQIIAPGSVTTASPRYNRIPRLLLSIKKLFVPPFRKLDRLIAFASLIHAVVAFSSGITNIVNYGYTPAGFRGVMLFLALICAVLYLLSYITVPLTIIALGCRWFALGKNPAKERVKFDTVGTILLIILQIFLASIGWTAWQYVVF